MLRKINNMLPKIGVAIFSFTLFSLFPFGNKAFAAMCTESWSERMDGCYDYMTNSVGIIIGILCMIYETAVWILCEIFT